MDWEPRDILVILRDFFLIVTWVVATIFLVSGLQDMLYDVAHLFLRYNRKKMWKKNKRLSLARLRARDQQLIACMVPAWNEGEVVGAMVRNILERVEYKNFYLFVGTYPNDPATQSAVDTLAASYPQIIKVVNPRPGPTTKADCLNQVFQAIKLFEARQGLSFDVIVMHDAEDNVHPQSFLLYNYLIPRVDAIQLPILPLPTIWYKWVHWIYADEFAEQHMKDVPVREKLSGFVPYAGVGTGFSRRAFTMLEQTNPGGQIFNEYSMTEDYAMSLRMKQLGLRSIFVGVTLADDKSKWYVPLINRPGFISNWAYFPMDFHRSVRQKTRWIIGISLQEWEMMGWRGGIKIIENLVKDRKVFVASAASLFSYFLLFYFVLFTLGQLRIIPIALLPVIVKGTALYYLVLIDTFMMLVRMFQRCWFVTTIYGFSHGIMSIPRLLYGNILNGLAAFRALVEFSRSRRGIKSVRWDKTTHLEGVGALPQAATAITRPDVLGLPLPAGEALSLMRSMDPVQVVDGIDRIPSDADLVSRAEIVSELRVLSERSELSVRAAVARSLGHLRWQELSSTLVELTRDRDWAVRANAARSILSQPEAHSLVSDVLVSDDKYAREITMKSLEQDAVRNQLILPRLSGDQFKQARSVLERDSLVLRERIQAMS